MSSDVKAKKLTATGALGVGPARIKALSFVPAAGSIQIRDGSASGTIILEIDTGASSDSYMEVPCDGIRSVDDPYVTLTTVTSVTVFYG